MQREAAAQLLVQIEGQWIVDFEQAAEFVGASHGGINGFASLLAKEIQIAQLCLGGRIRAEPIEMVIEEFFDQLTVERIILGAAGEKSLSKFTHRQRVEWIEIDPIGVGPEHGKERSWYFAQSQQPPGPPGQPVL